MNNDTKLMDHLLLEAADSSQALSSLNRLRKSRFERWSMQLVCRKIGIPSTGYFSDVLKGKRQLNPKYIEGVCKAFDLSPLQARYFELLVLRDHEPSSSSTPVSQAELNTVAAQMQVEYIPIPHQLSEGLLWHILVLSSFSLFRDPPTRESLDEFFGPSLSGALTKSLDRLLGMGLVELSGNRYSLAKTRIIFKDSEDGFSHLEFLERSITHAASQVKDWFPKADESIFVSTIVSVHDDDYRKKLPDVKNRIHAILNELNSSQGDRLVEFNLQLFPFDPKVFQESPPSPA